MGALSGLQISVLCPFAIFLNGNPLPNLPTLRAQALLIYLTVEATMTMEEAIAYALSE